MKATSNKFLLMFAVMAMSMITGASAQKPKTTESLTISAVMHCDNCVRKIEGNIPFEKGVKDLEIDFDNQKVVVEYDPSKTDEEKIVKAFEKIKVPAQVSREE